MKRELNVIVIVMDSLRQDHISYYNENKRVFHGVPVTKTPNLDKLALDGIFCFKLFFRIIVFFNFTRQNKTLSVKKWREGYLSFSSGQNRV